MVVSLLSGRERPVSSRHSLDESLQQLETARSRVTSEGHRGPLYTRFLRLPIYDLSAGDEDPLQGNSCPQCFSDMIQSAKKNLISSAYYECARLRREEKGS